ncbi:MAG: hypothetical protein QOF02_2848 [Blastocatellia bacterium]|jgi:hypothetical protein|nr:hypothetical protein [Blastocatellia bacterium]
MSKVKTIVLTLDIGLWTFFCSGYFLLNLGAAAF